MFKYALIAVMITAALFLAPATGANAAGSPRATAPGLSVSDGGRHAGETASAGRNEYRIESGGIERRYLMYLPDGYDDSSPLPVVFDFHGSGSDPDEEMQVSGLAHAAERDGFLLLMPVAVVEFPSGGHTWNVPPDRSLPDDVQFALDVLDHAAERVRINEQRVYVTGFSGGARLASEIACAAPDRIAALGAVGGLRAPRGCAGQPVPVVAFHGTDDPINPYAGEGADYWDYGIDAAVRGWVERNRCAAQPRVTRVSGAAVELRFDLCPDQVAVVLYRLEGGGHTWPGSAYPFPEERFGATERELDATRLMLEFFERSAARAGTGEATREAGSSVGGRGAGVRQTGSP